MATLSKQARALRKEIKRWQKDGAVGYGDLIEIVEERVLPLLRELGCHECLPMYYPHWRYCPHCGVALKQEG